MVSSATLIQLLTRFFLVLALIAVASSSARPHFGDTNQDDQEDISFENYIKNMDHPERSNIYNPEDDYYYYDIILRPPSRSNRYRSEDGYVLRLNNNDTPTIDGDTNADDDASNDETLLLRNIYKRVTNSRNSDAIYRRNGVDKKIKPKSPIRCLSGADQDTSNLVDTSSGLTNEQMEQLLQRLVEYNRASQYPYGWERLIRGPEMKRQSRFRQCYFNPLSDNNLFKSAGTQPTKLILNMY
ncbi:hypothetical protein QE152_g23704 [Popillia japonica]|uniref:Uncharacterized protein n=1 Tax=Popillia japonica TaxID=7064 RepID=A0AAW1KHI3_POPJA